ncbi:MAG: hypothetical protein LUE17_17925 [Planctomycetaceae bacterium]|nr:hypothetical protein [Planctomycetaceae bacterium]
MMHRLVGGAALLLALLLFPVAMAGQPTRDHLADQRLDALNSAIDQLQAPIRDMRPEDRSYRGSRLNEAFVALTGEAVNPLFGVTALGIYNYFRTPDALRESLPIYDQPVVWVPLLCIIALMLLNSTLGEAVPFLKVPLNALGDIVNKAGAVAVLPLVTKMFADAVAPMAAEHFASLSSSVFPVAYAGEGVLVTTSHSLGWLAGAFVGFVVYAAVWLTFNVVDVLILICPFPGVDALLKCFRLAVIGMLAGVNYLSTPVAMVIAVLIVAVSLLLAGWSFRLSVFGLVFSTDILFFRKRDVGAGDVGAFSCAGLTAQGVPVRSWGRLEQDENGGLAFSYRPWLILQRRRIRLDGGAKEYAAGLGLLNPFIVRDGNPNFPWLRLPPRYRGQKPALAARFGLRRVVACGASGALRSWLGEVFGSAKRAVEPPAA